MCLLIIGAADSLFVSRKLLQCYKNMLEKEVEEIQFSVDGASGKTCQVIVCAIRIAMWELVWDFSSVVTQLWLGESKTNHEEDSFNTNTYNKVGTARNKMSWIFLLSGCSGLSGFLSREWSWGVFFLFCFAFKFLE